MESSAATLGEPGALQRRLDACAVGGRIAVALACGGQVATAEVGHDGYAPWAAPVGCIAKLLTATLACSAAEQGGFALDTHAGELLGVDVAALRGVTVRQLLEHTHGLDDSLLAQPRRQGGVVDRGALLADVARLRRWAAPGRCYSYGHCGAWLVGAILERLHGPALRVLVREHLRTLGVEGVWSGGVALCSATGAGLALTADALARFGLRALSGDVLAAAPVMPLPGWHPLERGVCLGWKYAGGGWFGHQSVWPGASSFLRVQPQRSLALAVIARDRPAAIAAIVLFREHFPELFERQMPPPAPPTDEARAVGSYEQMARVVKIERTPRGLCAELWARDENGTRCGFSTRALLVPTRGVLFAQPATEALPYVELIGGVGNAAWLWNGRTVLRAGSLITARRDDRRSIRA